MTRHKKRKRLEREKKFRSLQQGKDGKSGVVCRTQWIKREGGQDPHYPLVQIKRQDGIAWKPSARRQKLGKSRVVEVGK